MEQEPIPIRNGIPIATHNQLTKETRDHLLTLLHVNGRVDARRVDALRSLADNIIPDEAILHILNWILDVITEAQPPARKR